MGRGRWSRLVLLAGVLAALAGGATAAASVGRDANHSAGAPWRVGVVYSRTGLLAAYGAEYVEGLKYGLQYATKGTGKVNGKTVNLTFSDDKTAFLTYKVHVLDPADAKAQFPAVHRFLHHKWYFDEAYSVLLVRPALVNGAAGVVVTVDGQPIAVIGFTVSRGTIAEIDAIADPERLLRLDLAVLDD